jgi:putative permease
MFQPFFEWLHRYFGRPQALVLLLTLLVTALVPIARLERWGIPHVVAVLVMYLGFLGLVAVALFGLMPLLWHQLSNLFAAAPAMLGHGQAILMDLPERYPKYISATSLENLMAYIKSQLLTYGQDILSISLKSLTSLVALCIYLVLVPLLVYFFLMDKSVLLAWVKRYLPKNRELLATVWVEVYEQIGNYVRGKVLEVIIVSLAFYAQFAIMDLDYAMLLAVLVGLSVIIPYVGAVLVTIPVFVIAFLQWGFTSTLGYFAVIYALLIALDANVLVPLLFAEAVSLHPVAIILAVLFFGGVFGFWGVFFAIPLASLVKAVTRVLLD